MRRASRWVSWILFAGLLGTFAWIERSSRAREAEALRAAFQGLGQQLQRLADEVAQLRQAQARAAAARPAAPPAEIPDLDRPATEPPLPPPPPPPPPPPTLAAVPADRVQREALEPGLAAAYYDVPGGFFEAIDFRPARVLVVRVDPQVDFDWDVASPHERVPVDQFAARWSGYLDAPADGEYLLLTRSDDGVRLFLDEVPLIVRWDEHAPVTDRAAVRLGRGLHRLRLEYFEAGGGASCRLWWQPPGAEAPGPIPAERLLHAPAERPSPPPGATEEAKF